MILIIAEKHSMAKNIASALGRGVNKNGFIECSHYLVSWAQGHLVELAMPEDYPEWSGRWNYEALPHLPVEWKWKASSQSGAKERLETLKALMERTDVTSIINACDADREGEGIFRRIYAFCGCNKPVKRMWNTTPVDDAIINDLVKALPDVAYNGLAAAAEGRAKADWLVGLNGSRAYSTVYRDSISVGRVQTPLLAMLVERRRQIESFKQTPFFKAVADMGSFSVFTDRYAEKAKAAAVADAARTAGVGRVKTAEYKQERVNPPTLFDLTSLQREASVQCGLTADQTLAAAQSLYEKKLATYPRTDSRYIKTADFGNAQELIPIISPATIVGEEVAAAFDQSLASASRLVNDEKVAGHAAILPTKLVTAESIAGLSANEYKVLMLVCCRFLAAIMQPALVAKAKLVVDIAGVDFSATGSKVAHEGWQGVAGACKQLVKGGEPASREEDGENHQEIPVGLSEGQTLTVCGASVKEGKTSPPKHYTYDTLLAAMSNAGRGIEDEVLKKAINDDTSHSSGLGTPATRAAIIKSLIDKKYAETKGKTTIIATPRGCALIDLVADDLKSSELTARWEHELSLVEHGKALLPGFLAQIEDYTRDVVSSAKDGFDPARAPCEAARKKIAACPICGKDVVKTGSVYQCQSNKSVKDANGQWRQVEGCGFKLFPTVAGKTLTENQTRRILEGKTVNVKGLKSKKGTTFDAGIKLGNNRKLEFAFDAKPKKPNV